MNVSKEIWQVNNLYGKPIGKLISELQSLQSQYQDCRLDIWLRAEADFDGYVAVLEVIATREETLSEREAREQAETEAKRRRIELLTNELKKLTNE